jgi:hypothetical protein
MWRLRLLAGCLLLVLIPIGTSTAAAQALPTGGQSFVATATLSGAGEVPPNPDSNATGVALYRLSPDGSALWYTLVAVNLTTVPVTAHIHAPAGPGSNAAVVAHLFPANAYSRCSSTTAAYLRCEGQITAADLAGSLAGHALSELIALMVSGNSYTNVQTTRHPGGEIRGHNEALVSLTWPGLPHAPPTA